MVLRFKCSKCLKVLSAQDEAAGKKVKCSRCGTFLRIPRPTPKPKTAASDSALYRAAATGDASAVEKLLTVGADVNAKNEDGRTALHVAANERVAKLLLAKGADVNARSNNGETPLHIASGDGRKDVAEALLENGADMNAETRAGKTPLHDAAMGAQAEMVEFLVKNGANVEAKAADGWTALDIAKWGESAGENVVSQKVGEDVGKEGSEKIREFLKAVVEDEAEARVKANMEVILCYADYDMVLRVLKESIVADVMDC